MEENKTTKQKICPNCGEHLTPEQDVCPVCGLGYAAYMEVKSNPKAELAKLYELVESYDGWSTPEEKKERRKEREEKWSKNRGISEEQEDSFLLIIVFIIIMLIYSIGLIPQHIYSRMGNSDYDMVGDMGWHFSWRTKGQYRI